jgi:hypothetical protein
MLIRDPDLQELNRRVIAERGVVATSVVENFKVIEQIGDRFLSRRVASTVHSFDLQTVEESLGGRVVELREPFSHVIGHRGPNGTIRRSLSDSAPTNS